MSDRIFMTPVDTFTLSRRRFKESSLDTTLHHKQKTKETALRFDCSKKILRHAPVQSSGIKYKKGSMSKSLLVHSK